MRTGRNLWSCRAPKTLSLDHWDMRTGRNQVGYLSGKLVSLDHWDMRTGRNLLYLMVNVEF